jgi:hypothetical protein
MMRPTAWRVSGALGVLKAKGIVVGTLGAKGHAHWSLGPQTAGPLWEGAWLNIPE